MEKKQIRPFETGLGIRNIGFLLSLSSLSSRLESKWILNQILEYSIQSEIVLVLFVIMIIKKEGIRLPTIYAILLEFVLQFYRYDQQYSWKIIANTNIDHIFMVFLTGLVIVHFILMYISPVYFQIPVTGSLKVGYTVKNIDDIQFAIFYPTNDEYQPKKNLPYFSNVDKYLDTLAYFTYRYPREFKVDHVPAPLLKISLGPLLRTQMMDVIANANLAVLKNKYPVMMYSHGFNSHMNLQATFCKDLASKGVIVIAPMHRDEDFIAKIKEYPVPLNRFKEVMNESVIKRKNDIQKIITFVLDPSKKFLSYFPNGNELRDSFQPREQIIMCGHSYGGLTSLATSLDDPRIYTTIVLDPAMSLFDEDEKYIKLLKTPQKKPFLILCSENFHKRFPLFSQREHIQTFLKSQKNYKNAILAAELKEFGHGNFVDMAFFIPFELQQLREDILKVKEVSNFYLMLNKLVEYFIYESQSTFINFEQIHMQNVVSQFEELTKNILEYKKKNFLYQFEI
ncbi:platelet-activating factor acetylhydrolase plasma/intracellular protein (macronuclear) [Tetrahymena thermophila SB210]|uniref:1-alkyl-2-acetylglycerophosphocholine esterase n=1 Tax=Tetrahymena thermophila (strain SB210) TaxID=312017 RepID=A4VDL5_TETTS|nr:platelet-activating factor acetylhydrolase plasma/intracellular protein [Tetrahymena thermophila SB210]EDK31616.2 platelet-activating factor acetylhydrolase plasma/intracellular protein [Tetrahymena thermophila SB210]|eukprot:XP_001470848.2 platelet-activating factor acetylhydrolase plasma/intracellular protein [Tetrahymena thermophila SB210]